MILFRSDYALMPAENVHTATRNISFIRMYRVLKEMGVKNNRFFLMLLDKDLRDVDPHNLTDDSVELKLRILREAKLNPWYVYRELIRIPATGSNGVYFRLNRANLGMIWLFSNHIDNLLIMPRQLGKTIASIAIASVITYITGKNTTFSMLTKDAKLRKENVSRLNDIREGYPKWMINQSTDDTDNKEEISYTALNNKYNSFVAQGSEAGAERLGRGMTTPIQHWDEIAYFNNFSTTYPIAISSTSAAVESAKEAHQDYGNILTTTAGKLNTDEGQYTHKLICNSLPFTEKLYDLNSEAELKNVVFINSKQGMVYSEFSYGQLGKTDEWFREKAARTTGGEDIISRDLLNTWTFGTNTSPLDKNIMSGLYMSRRDPDFVQYVDEFIVRWYIQETIVKSPEEFSKIPIIIGMDASENVGRDFTSFVFIDARDASVIATCMCDATNIIKVAMFACRWIIKPNCLFIPERNSVGVAIVDYCLMELDRLNINPFLRIYNTIIQDWPNGPISNRGQLSRPGVYDEHRRTFGFRTGVQSRNLLYKIVFFKAMALANGKVHDKILIAEIGGLNIKNGRIDHSNGSNDDSVVGYMLAEYVLFFGKNLNMYDFSNGDDTKFLSSPDIDTSEISVVASAQTIIDDLKSKINRCTDPSDKIIMMHQLIRAQKEIPADNDKIQNVDSVSQLVNKNKPSVAHDSVKYNSNVLSYLSNI